MSGRASRYAALERAKGKPSRSILIAHVHRTTKGKIRLARVDIRINGQKEERVTELPGDDPRYVFENDYKVRKAVHDLVKSSGRFSRFYDCSARVFYDS